MAAAREAGCGVLPLYILEPDLWRRSDMSGRQWGFVREALADLRRDLAARGQPLVLRAGPAVNVLAAIRRAQGIAGLWSHRETGTAWSWGRDAAVAAWARDQGIAWVESGHDGVLRGAADGAGWPARWSRAMASAPAASPAAIPRHRNRARPDPRHSRPADRPGARYLPRSPVGWPAGGRGGDAAVLRPPSAALSPGHGLAGHGGRCLFAAEPASGLGHAVDA
ncbi:deoxyribodipyrimidine photo-lyase [Tistrella bauzanensis]